MSDTSFQITQGSGTRVHTYDRSIGGQTVNDQVVLLGIPQLAGYIAAANTISIATANDHVIALMAGTTLNLYVYRIEVSQRNTCTSQGQAVYEITRLTTNGSGGTTVTPRPYDTTSAAAGASARTLDSSKGTEGVALFRMQHGMYNAMPIPTFDTTDMWEAHFLSQCLRIPAGTSNGLALKSLVANAAGTVNATIEFFEANF